jgi:3-phenylpropionate/cinnamic acid dioxygenase small subunit
MTPGTQALADRFEIADLLARYSTALDTKDWRALTSVFTPDATCDYGPLGSPAGIDEITALLRATLASLDVTQHLIGNLTVELQGDRATSSTYLIAQHLRSGTPGGDTYLIGATYSDQLARTADGWRIEHRRINRLWATGNREVIQRP